MTNFLDDYLTDYDVDLSSESNIDPIGTLIIWSAFGRQIFRSRINSISNDVRNFTLNLFHHYLVKKLIEDEDVKLSHTLQRIYQSKDSLNFKQACLIFLENLFVFSILRHDEGSMAAVETAGVLGISNARRRWINEEYKPELKFTHEPDGQILVRQLSLGVSGRYKTPLIELGFFDTNYRYHKPSYRSRWAEAEILISSQPNSLLAIVARKAYEFLTECVRHPIQGGVCQFSDVPSTLTSAYARAFASPQVVGEYARDFWLSVTELDQGAAGALLRALEGTEGLLPQEVVERALESDLAPEEKAKLEQIVLLEPFLADCSLLFSIMAARRSQSTVEAAKVWLKFGRDAARLPQLAIAVDQHANLPAIKDTAAATRLKKLIEVAKAGELDDQMRNMAIYHGEIMQSRGQLPWLNVESDGTVKVHARTVSLPEPAKRAPGAWHNTYYLLQFKSFVDGLCGVAA